MLKVCTFGNLSCPYAFTNTGSFGCNYQNYCDYQLPRDSRNLNLQKHSTGENNV